MKELYLDSANLEDIVLCVRTDAVAGVTTNPSLMAKEAKGDYIKKLDDICQMFQTNARARKHLSVEVTTLDPDKMYGQAHELRDALGKYDRVQLHVKIPVTFQTLEVISRLGDDGIKVNATACMTALQAKLAHDAGAPVISFFYNRMIDEYNGAQDAHMRALGQIATFSHEFNRNSKIICGSIRKPDDLLNCWVNGSDIVTASLKIIRESLVHPQTDKAIKQFQEDIERWLS